MAIITVTMPREHETPTKLPVTKTYSEDTVVYRFDAPDAHVTKVLRTENISNDTITELMNKLHDQIDKLNLSEEVKESYNQLAKSIQNE